MSFYTSQIFHKALIIGENYYFKSFQLSLSTTMSSTLQKYLEVTPVKNRCKMLTLNPGQELYVLEA